VAEVAAHEELGLAEHAQTQRCTPLQRRPEVACADLAFVLLVHLLEQPQLDLQHYALRETMHEVHHHELVVVQIFSLDLVVSFFIKSCGEVLEGSVQGALQKPGIEFSLLQANDHHVSFLCHL